MKFIIGKKLDMTQVWQGDKVMAVTKVKAEPCVVVQVKNKKTDGYEAVQIGAGEKKEKNISKPQKGHLKGLGNLRHLREFKIQTGELKRGDKIDTSTFAVGDIIKVTGTSKGKGFQGVVKRYGFSGFRKTHGNKDQLRRSGSVGAKGPAHVFKGTRMGGRMGDERVTTTNLEIIKIDEAENILYVKGSVPGGRNGWVLISGDGDLKIVSQNEVPISVDASAEAAEVASDEANSENEEKKVAEPIETENK